MANQFTLRGHDIEIQYTIGGNPGVTALIYKDETISRDFKPGDIYTDQTALGSLVSVRLAERATGNYTVFAFFLPDIAVPHGQTADFTTIGIHQEYIKHEPMPYQASTWRPLVMHATAKNVGVPL